MTQRGWAQLRAYRARQEAKWLKIKIAVSILILALVYSITHF